MNLKLYKIPDKYVERFFSSIEKDDIKELKNLLEKYPKLVSVRNKKGETGLIFAARKQKTNSFLVILENTPPALINLRDRFGASAFIFASKHNNEKMLEALKEKTKKLSPSFSKQEKILLPQPERPVGLSSLPQGIMAVVCAFLIK